MPEKNVLALALSKLAKDESAWYQEGGKHSIRGGRAGEFYIPDGHATGVVDIAAALGIKSWQLSRLRNPKRPEYDPEISGIIHKRDKKWTASYQDLFCAIVRRARYTSAMRSNVKSSALLTPAKDV